jgi:hypothetical protein
MSIFWCGGATIKRGKIGANVASPTHLQGGTDKALGVFIACRTLIRFWVENSADEDTYSSRIITVPC